eukprot:4058068-Prymnesium_polylepis.1
MSRSGVPVAPPVVVTSTEASTSTSGNRPSSLGTPEYSAVLEVWETPPKRPSICGPLELVRLPAKMGRRSELTDSDRAIVRAR